MFETDASPFISAIRGENIVVVKYFHEQFPNAVKSVVVIDDDRGGDCYLPLFAAVITKNFELIKIVYAMYPTAIALRDARAQLPIHECVNFPQEDWSSVSPTSNIADILRFLIKRYPQGLLMRYREYDFDEEEEEDDDEEGAVTPLDKLTHEGRETSEEGRYFQRLAHQAISDHDPEYLHELNYAERRGAMYVLYSTKLDSVLPTTSSSIEVTASRAGHSVGVTTNANRNDNCNSLQVWLLLRERGSRELHQCVLSFM
jgi:hypothetical protein